MCLLMCVLMVLLEGLSLSLLPTNVPLEMHLNVIGEVYYPLAIARSRLFWENWDIVSREIMRQSEIRRDLSLKTYILMDP
jgi:hypothetical protein